MTLTLQPPSLPLNQSSDGVIRLSGTRVTLDSVLASFKQGSTPEQIAQQFDVLPLADIYSVIGYYLQHRDDFDAYLKTQETEFDRLQVQLQPLDVLDIRARLLARQVAESR